jgi:uncharacterized cofD-like protein
VGTVSEESAPRVVCLGGGHGLSATLRAMRRLTPNLTAVVTVADDGGSSGRIRRELAAVPPGDLRMALVALAGEDEWGRLWGTALQHRFGGHGALAGHPIGNLVITGLAEEFGWDMVRALEVTAQLVGAVGRVLPMSLVPLEIAAEVTGLDEGHTDTEVRRIRGQVAVATTPGRVRSVSLVPTDPPACPQAVAAIEAADVVVLGPGSWFTSVLPHVLVPDLGAALRGSAARTVVTLNLASQPGETAGFTPVEYLRVLTEHAPGLRIDTVVADSDAVLDARGLMTAVTSLGAELVLEPVAAGDGTPRHDPVRLAKAFARVLYGDRQYGEDSRWR